MGLLRRGMLTLFCCLALTSCRTPAPNTLPVETQAWVETAALESASPAPPTPTEVLVVEQATTSETSQAYLQIPTPVEDPLQFVFPTPRPAPVSAWRPPAHSPLFHPMELIMHSTTQTARFM